MISIFISILWVIGCILWFHFADKNPLKIDQEQNSPPDEQVGTFMSYRSGSLGTASQKPTSQNIRSVDSDPGISDLKNTSNESGNSGTRKEGMTHSGISKETPPEKYPSNNNEHEFSIYKL